MPGTQTHPLRDPLTVQAFSCHAAGSLRTARPHSLLFFAFASFSAENE